MNKSEYAHIWNPRVATTRINGVILTWHPTVNRLVSRLRGAPHLLITCFGFAKRTTPLTTSYLALSENTMCIICVNLRWVDFTSDANKTATNQTHGDRRHTNRDRMTSALYQCGCLHPSPIIAAVARAILPAKCCCNQS